VIKEPGAAWRVLDRPLPVAFADRLPRSVRHSGPQAVTCTTALYRRGRGSGVPIVSNIERTTIMTTVSLHDDPVYRNASGARVRLSDDSLGSQHRKPLLDVMCSKNLARHALRT
jgi:hypothetical protein